jgi:two-component system, chemotaxis family, chemotaxis protein CheY
MKKLSVLIVDDSSLMRKIVERSLRQAGLELERVLEAENGIDALDAVRTHQVDLIFSDINMPKMDGIEFLRRIRTMERAMPTPVLMITTDGTAPKVHEAIALGARGYIRKPFTTDQLRQQVTDILAGTPPLRTLRG